MIQAKKSPQDSKKININLNKKQLRLTNNNTNIIKTLKNKAINIVFLLLKSLIN